MENDVLERLYRRHTKAVYLYLYSLCHDHDLAEDLMQETFLRALCSLEIAGTNLLPWLLTVARNLYLDVWRKERRRQTESGSEKFEEKADAGSEKGILEMMIQKERNQELYRAVQKLGSTEREAIVLYYFADISQEEIGKILGLGYGHVRVILYRAKKNLKKLLSGEEMTKV